MRNLVNHLRFGIRMLIRHPTVTAISLLTLALGIGASTAVFSVVNATLLTPLPFDEPDRLVRLYTAKPSVGWTTMTVSAPDFRDWTEQGPYFDAAGIFGRDAVNVMGEEHPDRLLAIRASSDVLKVLRVRPVVGQAYDPSSDSPDAPPVVLLSDATWRNRFGADPDVFGTTMKIDDVSHEVLGVLPPEVEAAMGRFDIWTPFVYGQDTEIRSQRSFLVIARLQDGVTAGAADRAMKVVGDRLAEAYPDSNRGHTVTVMLLTEVLLDGKARSVLFALSAAVAFVLLIACVNITNLLLATAGSREREFAVRTALGANSRHLVQQLLTESALLTAAGGFLGIAIAFLSVDILAAGLQATIGRMGEMSVDSSALGFAVVLLGVTSLGIGLPVALRASTSRFSSVIRETSRAAFSSPREKIRRDVLVICQVALALALMVSAGLMIRSLFALKAVEPGFDTENLLTLRVSLPEQRYPSDSERITFFERAVQEIQSLPGVRSVSASSTIPLVGDTSNSNLNIEEHPISDPADKIFVGNQAVIPGFLRTMGIPLLEGRGFTPLDRADTQGVIIINNFMARKFWPDESAIGKRVKFGRLEGDEPWLEVVGVMADYRQTSLDMGTRLETIYPHALYPAPAMTFVVRTEGQPGPMASDVEAAVWRIGPELAVYQIATMDGILESNTQSVDDLANLLGGFGIVALVLALGGLYGMMSFSVGQRTHEIGVRMALGAEARTVLTTILRRTAALVSLGVLAGGVIAWLLGRWLQGVLFETSFLDPITYASVATSMLVVGLLAGLIPAMKASKVDPVVALRHE